MYKEAVDTDLLINECSSTKRSTLHACKSQDLSPDHILSQGSGGKTKIGEELSSPKELL
jgi:hypothetical protein